MTKLPQKKKISVFSVSRMIKKYGRIRSETYQETPVECSNGSEASGEEHSLVEMT